MRTAFRLTLAALTVIAATATVTVVAYEQGRAEPDVTAFRYDAGAEPLRVLAEPAAEGIRVGLSRDAVIDLGQERDGCSLIESDPPVADCDLEAAFPDVGFRGRVTLAGSGRDRALTLTFGR